MKLSNLTEAQLEAVTFIYERDHSLLTVPMGFGKTVVTLTALNELIRDGVIARVLVFAPLRVCELVWASESDKWDQLTATVSVATGTESERRAALEAGSDITVINFDVLPWFFDNYDPGQWDALVVDELTKLKTVGGAWFKRLRKHIPKFKVRVGLTGTLSEEGLDKIYSMAMVVDGGEALGRNKDVFMRKHFDSDYMGYNWTPKPGGMEAIADKIAPFSYVCDADDQSLPPLITDYEFIDLPSTARGVYTQMAKEMALELEDGDITAANAAVLSGKLQQICSGFMYREDLPAHQIHNEKMKKIAKHVTARVGATLIVYQFVEELESLKSMFPDSKVLGQGISKAAAAKIAGDWNDGSLNVLLVHPLSAGHGLNLQTGGNWILFTGPIWSRDQTDQIIARIRRRGTPHEVIHATFLVARNTVEDHVVIPRVLAKGENAFNFKSYLAAQQ